jgi:hypothetical protein
VFFLLAQRMAARYSTSRRFDGPAFLVRASVPEATTSRPAGDDLGWSSHLLGPVTSTEVTGAHVGIMRRPYVSALAADLRDALGTPAQ